MALVRELEKVMLDRSVEHGEVVGTYTVFQDSKGQSHLQIDTYGSATRQLVGKKSQSIQFGPEALKQLRAILANEL